MTKPSDGAATGLAPAAARKLSRAQMLARTLTEQYGTYALGHALEQIEIFLSLGDYPSVAHWAKAAEALARLKQAQAKPRKPAHMEILPPLSPDAPFRFA
jgi:hypothetical protein